MVKTLGPYILDSKLGSGGTSTVFFAENSTNGNQVALKVFNDDNFDLSSFCYNQEIGALRELYDGGENII